MATAHSRIPLVRFGSWLTPYVGAGYTDGLNGLPNELKLKYLADNDFADLNGDALADAIKNAIKGKRSKSEGTDGIRKVPHLAA